MKIIEPKYVTFEQAKFLKEKGFDVPCQQLYVAGKYRINYEKEGELFNNGMPSLQIPNDWCLAPEQWMVVEWLRVKHGIWIQPFIQFENAIEDECEETLEYGYGIYDFKEMRKMRQNVFPYIHTDDVDNHVFGFNTPEEAYSASFDYILTNLI